MADSLVDRLDLLIAPPNIPDPRFRDTVMLVTYAGPDQHLALCVNRSTDIALDNFLQRVASDLHSDQTIYWGGPVSANTVWMLHDSGWHSLGTRALTDQISMTSSTDMFDHIRQQGWPTHYRVFFGYCAWAAGQLSAEIAGDPPWSPRHSWLIAEHPRHRPYWLFETPAETIWSDAVAVSAEQAVVNWL